MNTINDFYDRLYTIIRSKTKGVFQDTGFLQGVSLNNRNEDKEKFRENISKYIPDSEYAACYLF
jgi:hypothetical protein